LCNRISLARNGKRVETTTQAAWSIILARSSVLPASATCTPADTPGKPSTITECALLRDSTRGHAEAIPVKGLGRFCFHHIDDPNIEAYATPARERPAWYVAPLASERGAEDGKSPSLLVKQPDQKH
jgi:hypothetical protein